MNYVSLGSWCGTKMALLQNKRVDEPSLPFDSVRTSMEGIIDCIEKDFKNFFPPTIERDTRISSWTAYLGRYVGFYHTNLLDDNVIRSFNRKIERFHNKMSTTLSNVVFVRTIARQDFMDEVRQIDTLHNVIEQKYPRLNYILVMVILNQQVTCYYKNIGKKTFLFTVNDSNTIQNLGIEYKPIFDFIETNNLFSCVPSENNLVQIDTQKRSNIWLVDNIPMVNHVEN